MLLATIILLALALRVVGLGTDLWIDEIVTLTQFVRPPWSQMLLSYDLANNHLLNSILVKLAVGVLGEAEWAVRLPALVFGVGGVWALARLGALVAPRREALGAALLLAVSYHHIFFSQNARGYTALLFWATLATVFLIRLREAPSGRAAFGYIATMSLAVLSQLLAVFVLAGHALAFLLFRHAGAAAHLRQPPRLGLWALGGAGAMVLILNAHLLPQMLDYFATEGREVIGYRSPGSFLAGLVAGLPRSPLLWPALAVGLPVSLLGFRSYRRQSPFLAALWVAPFAVMVLTVVAVGFGVYPRFFIFVLPPFLLVLVRGVEEVARLLRERLGPRLPGFPWARLPLALLLGGTLASLALLPGYYRHPKQDFRGALEFVLAARGPGEPVVTADLAAIGYRYYAPEIPVVREPADVDRLCGGCQTLWLIYTFPDALRTRAPALFADLDRRFIVVRTFPGTVGRGAVVVARLEREGAE